MDKKEELMFQNVAYRPTVYKTGGTMEFFNGGWFILYSSILTQRKLLYFVNGFIDGLTKIGHDFKYLNKVYHYKLSKNKKQNTKNISYL